MDQVSVNREFWRSEDYVDVYANRSLSPVEVVILVRYRDELSGRVLEPGCGAGRILSYLVELGGEVHGIDLSPKMVEYCRATYPLADVRVGDVSSLSQLVSDPMDVIFAANNLIDVFDDARRREVLSEFHRCLVDGGLLIFSSHNLQHLENGPGAPEVRTRRGRAAALTGKVLRTPPADVLRAALRTPIAMRNRRRLAPLQKNTDEYAIVNDETFDYGLLHYYVRRDAQAGQLVERGFTLVECLDSDGHDVQAGDHSTSPWLHYVARKNA